MALRGAVDVLSGVMTLVKRINQKDLADDKRAHRVSALMISTVQRRRAAKTSPVIARGLVLVAVALAGLTLVVAAFAAQLAQYGGTTSQKVGKAALRITLAVGQGALSDVRVAATVDEGVSICSANSEGTQFVFSKGKAGDRHRAPRWRP